MIQLLLAAAAIVSRGPKPSQSKTEPLSSGYAASANARGALTRWQYEARSADASASARTRLDVGAAM